MQLIACGTSKAKSTVAPQLFHKSTAKFIVAGWSLTKSIRIAQSAPFCVSVASARDRIPV